MLTYPDYVYKTLARARDEGQWYASQSIAAGYCFDVLALFPDCDEAKDLVYELFCDEWTNYDYRVAIQQNVDEWDDRPWQQRRRLALSYRFTSQWGGWDREHKRRYRHELDGPKDIAKILDDGRMELLGAYCLGDEECSDYAWSIFSDALEKTNDPHTALLWIGKTYADLGFFTDSAEALGELCSRFDDPDAKRLLVEVAWWRDNAHRIPWIPPAGDGSRYDRMMDFIDPSLPKTNEEIRRVRTENQKERIAPYRPSIDAKLAKLFAVSIPEETSAPNLVDWSFLDRDDGQPSEPADWVKKQVRILERDMDDDVKEMIEDMMHRHQWTRNILPPSTPKRYDPNDPPFDAHEFLGGMDDDENDDL
jgi:hypothetical protein